MREGMGRKGAKRLEAAGRGGEGKIIVLLLFAPAMRARVSGLAKRKWKRLLRRLTR